ncbi:MAG TPA: hypothetical protein VM070_01820 [Candidatus Saccharimonadales bacterium]|nr:hypothetical protein [Candidatus Saccharimonadales bacterium]
MKRASFGTRKITAIIGTGILGAGLLGGMAFTATPRTSDLQLATAPSGNVTTVAEKGDRGAKLKAVFDGLVDNGVITRAQADAILDAISTHAGGERDGSHLRELVGDVFQESVGYIGLPAEAVKAQLGAGKSLGQIADQRPGKSRAGLIADLTTKADARIKAAVEAGKITADQAQQLRAKLDEAIVRIVDHQGAPRPAKAPAKPTQ